MDDRDYIVALGASAGGLQAIEAFFDHTPNDGVAYILIQHLSANFKSQMVQILSRHSKLRVLEATNNEKIENNRVYLIPGNKFMTIENGRLMLVDKGSTRAPHLTIDHFLQSLAAERGQKAIAVILSGTGSDGAEGVEAIKAAGGLVIVQDPHTAAYNAMPTAAIATGCADVITSPVAMPQVIEDYLNGNVFEVLELVKQNTPNDFSDYKRPTILRRINRRMGLNNCEQIKDYLGLLKSNPKELALLAADFLVGTTAFFRDAEACDIIGKRVIPEIIKNKQDGDILKIWVPGCSTGEEAYTLGILVSEWMLTSTKKLAIRIFATDINSKALDIASKGCYTTAIENAVSAERLQQFFSRKGDTYTVKPALRDLLIFARHDLVKNPPYCNTDLISCRNVLIYMNPPLQKKAIALMRFGINNGGYIFLGPSENKVAFTEGFTQVSTRWNIFKANKSTKAVKFDLFISPVTDIANKKMQAKNLDNISLDTNAMLADEITIAIAAETGYSGVCTDANLTVLRSFGNLAPYLKNELFKLSLKDLLPANILLIVKAAAHKALTSGERVLLPGLHLKNSMEGPTADIILKACNTGKANEPVLLILFKTAAASQTQANKGENFGLDQLAANYTVSLEGELAKSAQLLREANEKNISSSEYLQSFNEELLSVNEELQSSNEEMQSVNEELQSLNKEYRAAIALLTQMNDDLNNYFRSDVNGHLFVDEQLVVKKYSPTVVKHINLKEGDIGRPIANITVNFKYDDLTADINTVIATGATITKEVAFNGGGYFQVTCMPYLRNSSPKPEGAIISFNDITEIKKIMQELGDTNLRLRNFTHIISHNIRAHVANLLGIMATVDMEDSSDRQMGLGMIKTTVNALDTTIKNLREIINIQETSGLPHSIIHLQQEIKNIVANIELLKTDSRTTILFNFSENETIDTNHAYFESIVLNLVTNAIRYKSPNRDPVITFGCKTEGKYKVITVEDNGLGIDLNRYGGRLFGMYEKFHADKHGTGMGLFIVKTQVEAMKGTITAESVVGQGTTFKVSLCNAF